MNILDVLEEKIDGYDFEGTLGGFFTGFEIKELLDNKDKFFQYYENKRTVVENIDDLIDFIVVFQFIRFDNYYENLKPEIKESFIETINFFKAKFSEYKQSQYIQFINNNAKDIVGEHQHLLRPIVNLVEPFCKGCKIFVNEIIDKHFYLLLPLNDNYKNLIFSDGMLLQNALDKKHYEVFKYSRSKSYFSFIKICLDKKVEITSVNNLIDEIYEFGITLCNNCNDDNVLEFIAIAQDIGEFLKEIKNPKAFDFDK